MTRFWGHQDNPFPQEKPDYPCCPICGQECETIYKIDNEIVGCENCVTEDDFPGEDIFEFDPWGDAVCFR